MFRIMGIVNVTPDSFFDGGKYLSMEAALSHAQKLIAEGADILDIGGESSRPGAQSISVEEELARVIPVIKAIHQAAPQITLSIDTTKAEVAAQACAAGASIINDISGGTFDSEMLRVVYEKKAKFVLMHIRGNPRTMQQNIYYENLIAEINNFFAERIAACMSAGIAHNQLCLDPGIGFGKTKEHNYQILARLQEFQKYGLPLMIGLSMKSLLGGEVQSRLSGTIALNIWSILQGVRLIRVHHVAEMYRVKEVFQALSEQGAILGLQQKSIHDLLA